MDLLKYLRDDFHLDSRAIEFCLETEKAVKPRFDGIDLICEINQAKVLGAMQKNRLGDYHFATSSGYGYNDPGRDALEDIYADVFKSEAALVRPQMISGTHALTVALFGNLRHGDELVSVSGRPYDTLAAVIGIRKTPGSLAEHGVSYKQVDLLNAASGGGGCVNYNGISNCVTSKTKMVLIQRSKGYEPRPSLSVEEIGRIVRHVKSIDPQIICMVDNCYGEFVEANEPGDAGADLTVGSLIKNPGGGLAPGGGYIAGKREYVEAAAYRLTAPGLGGEIGPMLGVTHAILQGLFLAPQAVCASVKSSVYASAVFERLGFKTIPSSDEIRTDIVMAVLLNNAENVAAFCRGIQKAAPVDSYVVSEPSMLPGYDCPVIMAAGAFVQGSSIELSADAPMKPPYAAYMQGGLTWAHAKIGVIIAVNEMLEQGLIKI